MYLLSACLVSAPDQWTFFSPCGVQACTYLFSGSPPSAVSPRLHWATPEGTSLPWYPWSLTPLTTWVLVSDLVCSCRVISFILHKLPSPWPPWCPQVPSLMPGSHKWCSCPSWHTTPNSCRCTSSPRLRWVTLHMLLLVLSPQGAHRCTFCLHELLDYRSETKLKLQSDIMWCLNNLFVCCVGTGWVWGVTAEAVAGGVCEWGRRAGGSTAAHQEAAGRCPDDWGVAQPLQEACVSLDLCCCCCCCCVLFL